MRIPTVWLTMRTPCHRCITALYDAVCEREQLESSLLTKQGRRSSDAWRTRKARRGRFSIRSTGINEERAKR